ncbi:hypothetical protein ILUMI_00122 [Ignelater luminosus]|uniref:Uncharacterized protein n=1 Tax=Ignelater luminosus TaxID=2038154 RepID=A0A8K0GMY1_IGNLU|nr:hypothetical protein ILUMI_00122 [Ignelater luminosus]
MLNTSKDSKISLYISASNLIFPYDLSNTSQQSNGCSGKSFKKDTVLVSDQKKSQNFSEKRKERYNVDYLFQRRKSNRVPSKIPLIKARSLSKEATKDALDSISFILQEINSLENEVQNFSQISSDNNNVREIMKQFLVQINNIDARDDGEIVKKKNDGIFAIQRKIDKLEDYSEDQENEYSTMKKKGPSHDRQSSYIVLYPAGSLRKTYNHSNIPVKSHNTKVPSEILKIPEKHAVIGERSITKNIQQKSSNCQSKYLKEIFFDTNETISQEETKIDNDINISVNYENTKELSEISKIQDECTVITRKSNTKILQVIYQKGNLNNLRKISSDPNEMLMLKKNSKNILVKSNNEKVPSKIPKILRKNPQKLPTRQIFTDTTQIINSKDIQVDNSNNTLVRSSKVKTQLKKSKSPNECSFIYRRRNIRNLQEMFRKYPSEDSKQISFDFNKTLNSKEIQTELFFNIEKCDKESQCSTDDTERNMEVIHRNNFRRIHYFRKKKKKCYYRHFKKANSGWLLNSCILLEFLLSYFQHNLESVAVSKFKNINGNVNSALTRSVEWKTKFDKNADKIKSKYKTNIESIEKIKNAVCQNTAKEIFQLKKKFEDPNREVLFFDDECDSIMFRIFRMVVFQLQMLMLLVVMITIEMPSINFYPVPL